MAIELYRNPDGSVGGLDAGEVMVAPTQVEFEDCCCVAPCVDCAGAQPDAEATVDGSINVDVLLFEGTWNWNDFFPVEEGLDYCYWAFVKEGYGLASAIDVHYCTSSGKWYSRASMSTGIGWITFGGNVSLNCPDPGDATFKEITGLVHCDPVTGNLAGAFVLDCTDVRFPGVTLHVTLGG